MFNLLAQSTQPTIPGIDPSWQNQPGVKIVVAVSVVVIAALAAWKYAVSPLVVAGLKQFGLVRRTWKEEIADQVKTLAQASSASDTPLTSDIKEKVNAIATGTGTGDGTIQPAAPDAISAISAAMDEGHK